MVDKIVSALSTGSNAENLISRSASVQGTFPRSNDVLVPMARPKFTSEVVTFAESLTELKNTGTSELSVETSQLPVWFILLVHPVRKTAARAIQEKLLIICFKFLSNKVCYAVEKVLSKIIYFDSGVNAPPIIGFAISRAYKRGH